METMTIGLNRQQYHTLIIQMKEDKYLHQYREDFKIISEYWGHKQEVVMLTVEVKDAKTAYIFGNWIATVHAQQAQILGENYKIDSNWDNKTIQTN